MTVFYWPYILDLMHKADGLNWDQHLSMPSKRFLNLTSYVVSKQRAIDNKEIPG